MKKLFILLSILLLLNGCSKHQKDNKNAVPVITVAPTIAQTIDLGDISKNASFIRLETNSDCLIGGIVGKVEIANDKIFVYDSKIPGNLYCFDLNGKFLFQVGSMGQGPGEYVYLNGFTIDKKNEWIWMWDSNFKMLKYDLDGNFLESYTNDFYLRNLSMVEEGEGIMAMRLGLYRGEKISFIIYSINDKQILFQKEAKNDFFRSFTSNSFNTSKDRIIYTEPLNDTIFTVSKEGMYPYYVIDFGRRKLPKKLLDSNQAQIIYEQFSDPDNRYACFIDNANEDSKYLFFNYHFSGEGQTAIYSFESDKVINLNKISFMGKTLEDINIKYFFHIKQDNKFISFLPADMLTKNTVKEKQGQGYGSYSNINDLLPELSEYDNPVMVIGEYNFDGLFR